MENYIFEIREFLPIKFLNDEANEFLRYLEETYLINIRNNKYQFAFKAFHMLYMTCIYKFSWFIRLVNVEAPDEKTYKLKIKNNGQVQVQEEIITIQKLFEYSLISESEVIQRLLKKTGFHPNDFEKCIHHVNARNYCSHATGKIEYDEKGIDFLISDEIKYIERMENKIKPYLKIFFEKLIKNNWIKSFIGGDIENIFIENNISRKDLEFIIELDLPLFKKKSDNEKIIFQKILYLVFINEAQKYLELEKNIFVEKLPIFMLGLTDQINVKRNEEEKKIYLQEIIEEHLIPVINEFSEKDRGEAEKILSL